MIDGTSVKKVNGYEYLGYARQTGQLLVYKGSQNYKSLDIKEKDLDTVQKRLIQKKIITDKS